MCLPIGWFQVLEVVLTHTVLYHLGFTGTVGWFEVLEVLEGDCCVCEYYLPSREVSFFTGWFCCTVVTYGGFGSD